MRDCPICPSESRTKVFDMKYAIPEGWPLPLVIDWYECDGCGMVYGDGDFNQELFADYYKNYYGYGVNGPDSKRQLTKDADWIAAHFSTSARIVDFGGGGDDGSSLLVDKLKVWGFAESHCVNVGDEMLAECDVVYASHVLEHIYDLPQTMDVLTASLKPDGLFIVDVPDSIGLLLHWRKPILDFNTKHLNHFTYRTMTAMFHRYGFELVDHNEYLRDGGTCVQYHFKRLRLAQDSHKHILNNTYETLKKLDQIGEPVNVWGLNDRAWHILRSCNLEVIDFIDNDPAYRGRTYQGKEVQEKPRNDAPIVIIAQGQGGRLIHNIVKAGWRNRIIEI